MKTNILEKVNQLSPEKQREVEDFVDYLIQKYNAPEEEAISISEKRKRNMGWAKDKIWIAEDFNNTPEDFKEYI